MPVQPQTVGKKRGEVKGRSEPDSLLIRFPVSRNNILNNYTNFDRIFRYKWLTIYQWDVSTLAVTNDSDIYDIKLSKNLSPHL